MRLTKKVFTDLAIYMMGFGVLIGIMFPIFTRLIGIPAEHIDVLFIMACIMAGLLVGLVNIVIAKRVVGAKLFVLRDRMHHASAQIQNKTDIDLKECYKDCMVPIDSDDVISETSESFNQLLQSFLHTMDDEQSIRNFTEIFTNELDVERLSNKALQHLIHFSHSSAGAIFLDKGGSIEVGDSYLLHKPEEVLHNELVQQCFETNKRFVFDLTDVITIQAGLVDFHPKGVLVEPISYKNQVLGVILLASIQAYDSDILNKLSVYSHGLSLGIHNAIIYDRLEQLSILDPLTKVYNRRFGMNRLKEEFSRAIRTTKPISVLMLDIDHFKNVNDTYGHVAGDKVLQSIASAISQSTRVEDVVIRYGGEEFLMILPGVNNSGLKVAAEKIRRIVEERTIKYQEQDIKVTISLGGVSYPETTVEIETGLVETADENLYKAKESGRNQWII